MSHRLISRLRPFAGSVVFAVAGLLGIAMPAHAGAPVQVWLNAIEVLEVTVDADPISVSINDPAYPKPTPYRAAYQVTIKNLTNSNVYGVWFGGRAKALPQDTDAAFYSGGSTAGCTEGNLLPWLVRCSVGTLAAGASKQFTVTFTSPGAGEQLKLGWGAFSILPGDYEHGEEFVTLTTQDASQRATGFETFLPNTPNPILLFTGVNGGAGASTPDYPPSGSPGSPATKLDPFTTTIVAKYVDVVGTGTTASVLEETATGCSPAITQCYRTTLTIPEVNYPVLTPLIVYLRFDTTRIGARTSLSSINIYYETDPNPLVSCASAAPTTTRPCIESRKRYIAAPAGATIPGDWPGDVEIKVNALRNGRYFN